MSDPSNSAQSQLLFEQWNGHTVPRSFSPGFVALSYVVSYIGAASTLELINRRTAPKGKFNHLLLIGAAVTMGGIAIWSMHYVGNRAIDMGDGERELQIAYSGGITALSFFVPIFVLLAAFTATGTSNKVSWWRICIGGTLAGGAICGMHYLGNAAIDNYHCVYNVVNVIGAALIAVAASITALALFFVFRASWTNTWWKRAGTAVVLAGAVSGMHWCASIGTQYQLVQLNTFAGESSRNITVIVIICLSIGACFVMAGIAFYTARVMQGYAQKAQQIVLASAIFDKHGRVLVSTEGLLPSEKITDSFLEKTSQDSFTVAHPLFHWMFQASRNWSNISSLVDGMINHLAYLPHCDRDLSRGGIRLINEHGELIENYDLIFRELFCAAALNLAEKTKSNLTQVGILWDEILPTGSSWQTRNGKQARRGSQGEGLNQSDDSIAEKGQQSPAQLQDIGRGSLMFLVRRADSPRDIVDLEAAGYRFAELHQVSGIIGSSMQIRTRNVENKLRNMATYAEEKSTMEPGVHLGFFAVRARVGSGFDILVRASARNLLPSVRMPMDHVEAWQLNLLKQFNGLSPSAVARKLEEMKLSDTPNESLFATQMASSLAMLRSQVEDSIFEESTMTARVVQAPCRHLAHSSPSSTASLITFKLVVPIHSSVSAPHLEFIPLGFFKVHQLVYKDSPHHLAFRRSLHREISPILNAVPIPQQPKPVMQKHIRVPNRLRRFRRPETTRAYAVDADGNPIPTVFGKGYGLSMHASNHSSSTLKLWNGPNSERSHGGGGGRAGGDNGGRSRSSTDMIRKQSVDESSAFEGTLLSPKSYRSESTTLHSPSTPPPPATQQSNVFGGIMVSQEITVNVFDVGRSHSRRILSSDRSRGDGSGIGITSTATARDAAIEMQPLGTIAGAEASNTRTSSETSTFVDELFAVCLDGR